MRRSSCSFNTRRSLRLAIRSACLALPLLTSAPAFAQTPTPESSGVQHYSISSGPLSSALAQFAAESGVMLSSPATLTANRQSGGLDGEYGVTEGFARVLGNSGLRAVQNGEGTWTIVESTSAESTAVELNPLYVQGSLGNALGSMEGYNVTHSSVATKTSKEIAKTTQSVSVVTRDQIENQGSITVAEALRYTPGVLTNPYGHTQRYDYLALRGINDGSVDNIIIDGLKAMGDPGSFTTLQIDPFFLERIDVLKGPSSVLYGRSNPGGLAALTTKRPSFETSGRIEASYGSNATRSLGLDYTAPLNENIAYRLVGVAEDGDSQTDGVKQTRYALMPSITFNLGDDTLLDLYAYLQHDPNGGYHGSLPASGTIDKRNGKRLSSNFFEGEESIENFSRTQQMVGYEFEHRFDDVWSARQNFRYLDAETELDQIWQSGYTSASGNALNRGYSGGDEKLHAWIVDNMLQAEFDTGAASHTVVLGLDYQYSKNRIHNNADYATIADLDIVNPVYGNVDLSNVAPTADALRRQKQTGIYLQDLIEVGRWNLSAGLRQDWYDVSIDDNLVGKDANRGEKLSGHLGALYTFDNGIAPYLSYSTSFNPTSNYSSGAQILDPTTGEQWEAGVKFQPNGTDDLYTISVFDMTLENLYAKENDLESSAFYKGVGEVQSRGVELEARVNVTDNLRVLGSYTWNDVEYSKSYFAYDAAGELIDAKGNTPYQTPEHMGSVWADYRFDQGAFAGVGIGAGARYVGSSWGNDAHDFKVPSYTLFDASVSYDLQRVGLKGTTVRVNANNLTDKYYVASCYSANACYLGAERNITATVSHSF
ncbi:TonB-dependent siderophore receptor [Pseudomonas matsuisoli]|uniref:Ferrioxamine receptor FoxA n=1 Tax=Pseudomonas matsuisoli TaxID=1515666 RepID=A0A917Q0F2_9PSED|nr:TonB-dependent siderophore receptor [Pseudomonas matsuisoli]GGK04875.1 ferrioxamine receptor FoxA [Pseudomonas matsuisoli]